MEAPDVGAEYLKEIEKARRDLRALIYSKNCAPLMLRLAWQDAGTYDHITKTGGVNGSIRNEEELDHSCNKGLKIAIDFCDFCCGVILGRLNDFDGPVHIPKKRPLIEKKR